MIGEKKHVKENMMPREKNRKGKGSKKSVKKPSKPRKRKKPEPFPDIPTHVKRLVDSFPFCVSYIDSKRRYQFNNKTYHQWFGKSLREIHGQHMRTVVGEAIYRKIKSHVDEVLTGNSVKFELKASLKRSPERCIHVHYVPQMSGKGEVGGFYAMSQDMSDKKSLEDELARYRYQLEDIVKARTLELEKVNEKLSEELVQRKHIEEELNKSQKMLIASNKVLQRVSILDGLTGIFNRRYFDENFEKEFKRAQRDRTPISLFMIDIDFFKLFNDHYGHQKGDAVLQAVATCLSAILNRPGDFIARYGGEEFTGFLPGTGIEGATTVSEILRKNVEGLKIKHAKSKASRYVTVSMGVTTGIPREKTTPKKIIGISDKALYQAKKNGRNQVVRLGF